MKKKPPSSSVLPPPAVEVPSNPQGEGGGGKTPQSTIKLLRPDQVWHPKIGAPHGNRNALKPFNALRRRVRELHRRMRQALRAVP